MNYYVGIDIGGTKIATVVADKNFNILNKKRFLTAETKLPLKSIERIVENIDIQLKEMAITKEDILGIGISCGGGMESCRVIYNFFLLKKNIIFLYSIVQEKMQS